MSQGRRGRGGGPAGGGGEKREARMVGGFGSPQDIRELMEKNKLAGDAMAAQWEKERAEHAKSRNEYKDSTTKMNEEEGLLSKSQLQEAVIQLTAANTALTATTTRLGTEVTRLAGEVTRLAAEVAKLTVQPAPTKKPPPDIRRFIYRVDPSYVFSTSSTLFSFGKDNGSMYSVRGENGEFILNREVSPQGVMRHVETLTFDTKIIDIPGLTFDRSIP